MSPPNLMIAGLVLNALGVVKLFFFGMPFRVALREGEIIVTQSVRPEVARRDSIYRWLGNIGLGLILLGTSLQIVGTLGT